MNTAHSSFNLKTLFSFLYIFMVLSVGLSPSVGLAGDCTGNCLIVIGDPLPSPNPILLPVYGGGDSGGGGLGPPGGPGEGGGNDPTEPTEEECLDNADIENSRRIRNEDNIFALAVATCGILWEVPPALFACVALMTVAHNDALYDIQISYINAKTACSG